MTIGNAWGNNVLDYMMSGTTKIALHVADPGPDGNLVTEVSGGSYSRQTGHWVAAASRTTTLSQDIIFDNMPRCIIRYIAVWKLISGVYKIIAWAPFPSAVSVGISDRVVIEAGNFTVSI